MNYWSKQDSAWYAEQVNTPVQQHRVDPSHPNDNAYPVPAKHDAYIYIYNIYIIIYIYINYM